MNTYLIDKSSKILFGSTRPKSLSEIPGAMSCNLWLLWCAHTIVPFIVFPLLTSLIAAASWYWVGTSIGAMVAGVAIAGFAFHQGIDDRRWLNAYFDYVSRFNGCPLRDEVIKRFLVREFLTQMWPFLIWIAAWTSISLLFELVLAILRPQLSGWGTDRTDALWFRSVAALAITFAAREIATRRAATRQIPAIPAKEPIADTEPSIFGQTYIRGTILSTVAKALARQCDILGSGDLGILWGAVCLPSIRCMHFCILGLTRGGKSIVIRLVMQDTLYKVANPLAGKQQRTRALIYDPKPELFPFAKAIQPHAKFIITNPSDARCHSWDWSKDFTNISSAEELARLLVPVDLKQRDSFYPKAVRALLTQVFKAYMLTTPGLWTLRDVFEVLKSDSDLQQLLDRHPETQGALEQISRNGETKANIDLSVYVELAPYRTLAARWHHSSASFSLTEWMESESVLMVGRVPYEKQLFDALNALLLNRSSELLLSQPDRPDIRTYLYLDELATVSGFSMLESLMTTGLSKFVSVILASQGIEGLRKQFGNEETDTILSMCSNKAFLCLSRVSAEWAANQIGKTEWREIYDSWSKGWSTSSTKGTSASDDRDSSDQHSSSGGASGGFTSSVQRHERFAQLPEDFQHVAKPNPEMNLGLRGTFLSDSGSAYGIVPTDIPAESLFEKLLLPPDRDTEAFIPRPPEHDLLPPWTEEDRARLGFPPPPERTPLDTFLQ